MIQRRGPGAGHAQYPLHASAAGYVEGTRDRTPSGRIEAALAAVREVLEETGLEVASNEVQPLALAREARNYAVGLCGVVAAEPTGPLAPVEGERYETAGLELWEFEPAAVRSRLDAAGGADAMVPHGLAALILALVQAYGIGAVERAWH